jgi:hypothetical protein
MTHGKVRPGAPDYTLTRPQQHWDNWRGPQSAPDCTTRLHGAEPLLRRSAPDCTMIHHDEALPDRRWRLP